MLAIKKRLGDMLVEEGIIDEYQRSAAIGEQKRWGGKLGSVLVSMGLADENAVAYILEKQFGQRCIILKNVHIPSSIVSLVKPDIAKKYCIMPLDFENGRLSLAIANPNDLPTIDELAFILGMHIKPVLAIEQEIKKAITRNYH